MKATHADLVHAAHWWVRHTLRCSVALAECGASMFEIPDVIGWGASGFSVVVECKASRADFLADRKKFFRRMPDLGMGAYRWFFTPRGLIEPSELPERWGLAELRGTRVFKVRKPESFVERAVHNEMQLLVSALSRVDRSIGLQVFAPAPSTAIRIDGGVAVAALDLEGPHA